MDKKIKLETFKATREIVFLVNDNGVLKTNSEEWEFNATFGGGFIVLKSVGDKCRTRIPTDSNK